MRFRFVIKPILIMGLFYLSACSTSAERYKEVPKVSVADLLSGGTKYYGKQVIVEGCLTFDGSKRYKLWRFGLSPIKARPEDVEPSLIFVEGDRIPRRYRKNDIEKETKTGETTYVVEVIEKAEWRVQLLGTYLDEKAALYTGGHILFEDFYDATLAGAKLISEIHKGCEERS